MSQQVWVCHNRGDCARRPGRFGSHEQCGLFLHLGGRGFEPGLGLTVGLCSPLSKEEVVVVVGVWELFALVPPSWLDGFACLGPPCYSGWQPAERAGFLLLIALSGLQEMGTVVGRDCPWWGRGTVFPCGSRPIFPLSP